MASLSNEPGGRRTIQFVGSDGKRRSIRLGKTSQRTAEAVKLRVEALVSAKITGHALDGDTSRWVANLDAKLAEKLARVGLIPERGAAAAVTLGAFLDEYLAKRDDLKGGTLVAYSHTARNLKSFFGADKPLDAATPGDADDFRRWLVTEQKLSAATVARRCSLARMYFRSAVRHRLIPANPFEHLKGAVRGNPARFRFITREMTARILDTCPDLDWRLLVALARYGGLRTPSESLSLRWQDIDWERNRITVHSPKTEHHEGKATRIIPLFPELKPFLEEAFDRAEPGAAYVINRYRFDANETPTGWKACNLRTTFAKIVRRAGLEPWPKLWQNMRSTRQTELAESFPSHVVAKWIGNSVQVANEHYLQLTDQHFERAVLMTTGNAGSALQNPVQQAHASGCTSVQAELAALKETPVLPGFAASCPSLHNCHLGAEGFEPPTLSV